METSALLRAVRGVRAAEVVSAHSGITPLSTVLVGRTGSPPDQGSSTEGSLETSVWANNLVNQIVVL